MRGADMGGNLLIGLFWTLVFSAVILFIAESARADEIDMRIIAQIESSGNPHAWNKKDDSRGLYQITPICLKEWNNFHATKRYTMEDLWDVRVNTEVADWYLNTRIPSMLKHYNIPDNTTNRIIAWNAGISYLVQRKEIPSITKSYIKKYEAAR